jgi:hypothetical protein
MASVESWRLQKPVSCLPAEACPCILKANHKASGLAAGTINQMLSSPALPPRARATILTYLEEKLAGLYGHNKTQLRRFAAGSLFAGNVLVATLAWIIVTLVH